MVAVEEILVAVVMVEVPSALALVAATNFLLRDGFTGALLYGECINGQACKRRRV